MVVISIEPEVTMGIKHDWPHSWSLEVDGS